MPISAPSFKPRDITLQGATTPTITNLSLTTAGVEVSHALQTNLKSITIRSRNAANLKMAFVLNESSTKYVTIRAGAVFAESGLSLTGVTLYLQSDTDSTVVEILEFS